MSIWPQGPEVVDKETQVVRWMPNLGREQSWVAAPPRPASGSALQQVCLQVPMELQCSHFINGFLLWLDFRHKEEKEERSG